MCLGLHWLLCFAVFVPEADAQVTRPLLVPGRIEAENYDTNGAGISYLDLSTGNNGGVYRTDDVDIEATQDSGGGYNVGWISAGEWLNYTVSVQETAVYRLAFRVAAQSAAGAIQVSLDGLPLCGVKTPVTGGWQSWQTATVSNIVLRSGLHSLRVDFQTGGCNLNYLDVTREKNLTGGFLRTSGKQIVDGEGNNVVLRGMGLGNWMLQEPYMMNVSGIANNQQQLKAKITDLVGTDHMAAFYDSWLTNAFREIDVQTLAQSGFNSIRLPMHYNLFTLPADQEPVPGQNTWLPTGFKLVDDLLTWCESNHVYLILDMHACPGGQGYDQAISDYSPPAPSLWESSTNRSKLIALWRELAGRYAARQWIGGYDVINEPNWTFENKSNLNGCSDQTNAPLRQLMMDLTTAIRQADTNHIIFLMGNCWGGNYNGMLPPWDPNLVIGFHKYWDDPTAASLQGWVNLRDQWNMPVWLGESGENSNEWFRDVVRASEQLNIGWAWWPWKKIGDIAGPVFIRKPAGYQAILDYWRNAGPRPSTNAALNGLLALAQAARFENCDLHRDVLDALIRPDPQGVTLPFKTNTVPGLVFASDYDLGRQGEAYFDTTTTDPYNSGSAFRNDSVDIQSVSDPLPANGYNLGWLDPGDWMKYSVAPLVPGPYRVYARVAGGAADGSFYLESGGSNVTGIIAVPSSGGWQNWTTIPVANLSNSPALSSFKLVVATHGFNLSWLSFETVPGTSAGLPVGWTHQDVGSPGLPGSAAVNTNSGAWVVSGSGADIWNTSDQFHFAGADLTGDGMLVARVLQLENTGPYPKVGVMLRDALNPNASYAFVFAGSNTVSFESRSTSGVSSTGVGSIPATRPQWLKVMRTGGSFTGFASSDGATWTSLGTRSIAMGVSLKAGLAVCANNNNALNAGVLDHVSLVAAPTTPLGLAAGLAADGKIVLTWPDWAAGYRLYTTTNLAGPVVWSVVTNIAVFQDGTVTVALPKDSANRFFRLAAP